MTQDLAAPERQSSLLAQIHEMGRVGRKAVNSRRCFLMMLVLDCIQWIALVP